MSNGAKEAKNSDPQALAGQTDRFIFLSYYILLLLLRHIIICFCKKMKKKKKSLRWMSFERESERPLGQRARLLPEPQQGKGRIPQWQLFLFSFLISSPPH